MLGISPSKPLYLSQYTQVISLFVPATHRSEFLYVKTNSWHMIGIIFSKILNFSSPQIIYQLPVQQNFSNHFFSAVFFHAAFNCIQVYPFCNKLEKNSFWKHVSLQTHALLQLCYSSPLHVARDSLENRLAQLSIIPLPSAFLNTPNLSSVTFISSIIIIKLH